MPWYLRLYFLYIMTAAPLVISSMVTPRPMKMPILLVVSALGVGVVVSGGDVVGI